LLNRVDELYFNDYECPESEVDSDVENFKSDNEVDYVEHFVEPSVDDTREYNVNTKGDKSDRTSAFNFWTGLRFNSCNYW
jgi:hypothetical protein